MRKQRYIGHLATLLIACFILFACQSGADAKNKSVLSDEEREKVVKDPEEMQKFLKVDSVSVQRRKAARMKRRAQRDSAALVN